MILNSRLGIPNLNESQLPACIASRDSSTCQNDLKALIDVAESFPGPCFLVPTCNADLMRWCLAENLRMIQTMTLMTIGFYNEPNGSWLPSVAF
jgi:hypothetical protein